MSDDETRRPEADPLIFTINLRAELCPAELESFLEQSAEAGKQPVDHFKAITIGSFRPHPHAA